MYTDTIHVRHQGFEEGLDVDIDISFIQPVIFYGPVHTNLDKFENV